MAFENIDWYDPEIVTLATYISNGGKTWRDNETGKLVSVVNGKFIPRVRDLFMKFFPSTVYHIGGKQEEVRPGVGVWRHHLTIKDPEFLEILEKKGYSLGSRRRRPNPEVINAPHLFKYYLRVLWEIHGKVLNRLPLTVAIEEKYPQELSILKDLFLKIDIYTEIRRSNFFALEFSDKKSIENFFGLFDWEADWRYGKKSIESVKWALEKGELEDNGNAGKNSGTYTVT